MTKVEAPIPVRHVSNTNPFRPVDGLTGEALTRALLAELDAAIAEEGPDEIAMIIAIAYRFMPTVAEELERLMKAQASRGADFGRPGRLQFIQRTRQLVPVTVPLFVSAFRRAEELIVAMESRCYVGGAGRSAVYHDRFTSLEWISLGVALAFTIGIARTPFPW